MFGGKSLVNLFLVLTVTVVFPVVSFAAGIVISGDNVGIGTATPAYPLDVRTDGDFAIVGHTPTGYGVYGVSSSGFGVYGSSSSSYGVHGDSNSGYGVHGSSDFSVGVYGASNSSYGLEGWSDSGIGVVASSNSSYAGYFLGPVHVAGGTGNVTVDGNITAATGSVSAASFSGNGSGLTSLDGAKITVGTIAEDKLSGTISGSKISGTVPNSSALEGQSASDIIAAASDETRTPISSLPYTISTSGSYYLTGNLTSTGDGIVVNADDVTIDFNGYAMTGPGTGSAVGTGIYMNGRKNVEIKNGTVRAFGYQGIVEISISGKGHRIIHMRVAENGGTSYDGIYLFGSLHLIRDCSVNGNGYYGIHAYVASIVTGNTVSGNGYDGIYADQGSTVTGNTALTNHGDGIDAHDSTVTGNTVYGNDIHGINSYGSTVSGNTASGNGGEGIYANTGSTVTGNTASGNGYNGIYADQGSTVKNNTAYNNSQYGIYLSNYNLVDGNSAYNNTGGNMTACPTCVFGVNVGAP